MRLLIVHDRSEIAAQLEEIARTEVPECAIERANDVFTARDRLRASFYDLAIVDLTLPIVHGKDEPCLANVDLLLGGLFSGGEYKAPADILGISVVSDALDTVAGSIGQHLMACLHEDVSGAWRAQFAAKVRYVRDARRARQLVANSTYDVDLVVMTALDKEARPYADLFELDDCEEMHRAKSFLFEDRLGRLRRGILHSVGLSGQAPCAAATQALLTQFRPRLVAMTGFCGGVKSRTALGDVIAFRSSAAWDYGKWTEKKLEDGSVLNAFLSRPKPLPDGESLMADVIRDLVSEEWSPPATSVGAAAKASDGRLTRWSLYPAGAGSGSAVITASEKLDQITALSDDIWAVDMESYAFYYACRNTPVTPPDYICLKAVADHCNGEKNNDFHAACSIASAHLLRDIVVGRYPF